MSVKTWWLALIGVSLVNICAWILAGVLPVSRATGDPASPTRRRQLLLSAPFVFGCAFRSVFPRADVQRICLFDTWWSSVLVGRSVATVAEIGFVAQWAILLHQLGTMTGAQTTVNAAWVIVPLIALAETFSWYAVATTYYVGNMCEESTWGVVAILMFVGMATVRPRLQGSLRAFVGQAIWICAGYVVFMYTIDVPMYVGRWRADTAAGSHYLPIAAGLRDAATRWVVTWRIEDWRWEMLWMSLYFSFGVWISVALIRASYPPSVPVVAPKPATAPAIR